MLFSQRIGKKPAVKFVQREQMDEDLRNSLWNALTLFFWDSYNKRKYNMGSRVDYVKGSNLSDLIQVLWLAYFKKPLDNIPKFWEFCLGELRKYFFNCNWNEVYDFIEFVRNASGDEKQQDRFSVFCNTILEKENSAYRFVDGKIMELTSEEEIKSIEEAVSCSEPFPGVKEHLSSAIGLLRDRQNPDFRNSIKESISAVESLAKHIAKDEHATLGEVLKEIEKHKDLHSALKKAFSSLYGYTSDEGGIRHALTEKDKTTKADAKFMLVSCSAFINYVIAIIEIE